MNNNYLKISSPVTQFALMLILLAGGMIFASLLFGIVEAISGLPPSQQGLNGPVGLLKLQQALSSIASFLIPSLLYARITYKDRGNYFLGFRKPGNNAFFPLAIILFLVCIPLEGWLGQLNKGISLPAWMVQAERDNEKLVTAFLSDRSVVGLLVNLLVMAIIPGICEEAIFRGVLQRILIRMTRSPWGGIILSGLFFSAFHLQFEGFFPRAFLGALLGAAYWYSGSLWVPIVAHAFTNGIQVVAVLYYPRLINENPYVPIYQALISLLLVVGLLLMIRRRSTVTYAEEFRLETTDPHQSIR